MTPERAQSIRDHWAAYGDLAREPLLKAGYFRVPVKQKLPTKPLSAYARIGDQKIPIYEYRLEHGWMDGEQKTRVVCEGVQVEIGPLWKRAVR